MVVDGNRDRLQDVFGVVFSEANAINATGQSVGSSETVGGDYEAVLWSPSGQTTVLQDAGGAGDSYASAINYAGESVGYSDTTATVGGPTDAVLWSSTGQATVLQDAGGQGMSFANAINAFGQSVGYSYTASGYEAVLWGPKGKARDLDNILGSAWSDTIAVGINNSGDIVGYGEYQGHR